VLPTPYTYSHLKVKRSHPHFQLQIHQCIPGLDVFELFPFVRLDFLYQFNNESAAFLVIICVSKSNDELICNRRELRYKMTQDVTIKDALCIELCRN
jgi:hypothetical protein